MSVWPNTLPVTPSLSTAEGALISISVHVEPHSLESLLDALAQVRFPINPQIYHDAALVYRYADGREEIESVTLVEFPAYSSWVDDVRRALEAYSFDAECVRVTAMLEEIQAESQPEAAPDGAAYVSRHRLKRRPALA
jgi:hypothetical protein